MDLGQRQPEHFFLLLHGFPDNRETWRASWRYFEQAFPNALIFAPTMRGYEPSTVVAETKYTQNDIATDNAEFIRKLSKGAPVHVVGHDWGAVNAYVLAALYSDLLTSVTTLSIPYSLVARAPQTMLKHPKQLWYSSYMITMQLPFVYRPRLAQRVPYIPYIKQLWEYWSPTWNAPKEELQNVCDMLHQPGVADATTAYYRCMRRSLSERSGKLSIDFENLPVLMIGGSMDGCVAVEVFEADKKEFGDKVVILEGLGHFMQREDPERVAGVIINFIKQVDNPRL
ncbi:hypothetical protein TRVA0_071S00298 [Trichomonascus vanleenenianus]|uniref:alpha/beta fold hydrolase n=1 Tax=Trichomonascus vanleenenianus TaxID=2268995 RepID=UPI003ECA6576